jgi:uncharacterized hydrophobic protein (TIGR00271 family)
MEIREIPAEKIKEIKKCIGPFCVNEERQNKVYGEIKENAKGDFDFFVLTIFSAIIITLGLIIDSSAVVIGGMLLAPLVWPVLALSLAIIKGRSGLLQKSVSTLIKSSVVILLISFILGFVSPDYALKGSEFVSRTSPTIFELFIALAAGFVGAFVITYPKIGAAIAGVVVAAALVPPIAVMGLSISHGNLEMAGGAFILYLSNLIAVTFSASILFLVSKFKGPSTETGQDKRKSNIRWTLIFLVVMAIPLFLITSEAIKEKNQQNAIRQIISAKFPMATITSVDIEDKEEVVIIDITIQHSDVLTDSQVENLANILSQKMNKSVVPRITIVPIVKLWENNNN